MQESLVPGVSIVDDAECIEEEEDEDDESEEMEDQRVASGTDVTANGKASEGPDGRAASKAECDFMKLVLQQVLQGGHHDRNISVWLAFSAPVIRHGPLFRPNVPSCRFSIPTAIQ